MLGKRGSSMAQKLKIISINFKFKNPEVVLESTLFNDHALFDFDVVVIRPHSLPSIREPEWGPFEAIQNAMKKKKGELMRLLAQGGLLIFILHYVEVREYHTVRY